jgi:hypothetical protein
MQENLLPNSEPEFLHRSAVRQLCKWRAEKGLQWFRDFISKHKLDEQLLADYADQWNKGNRTGEWGKWI